MTAEFRAEMKARRERQNSTTGISGKIWNKPLVKALRAERKARERMKGRGEVCGPPTPYKPHRKC